MTERDTPALLPPTCADCGHRASLHHDEGCRALVLGKVSPMRACACPTTLRAILGSRYSRPPAELVERRAI